MPNELLNNSNEFNIQDFGNTFSKNDSTENQDPQIEKP